MLRLARHLRVWYNPPGARSFRWTAVQFAQANHKAKESGKQDVIKTLEASPVVQTVLRRINHRAELQSQVCPSNLCVLL